MHHEMAKKIVKTLNLCVLLTLHSKLEDFIKFENLGRFRHV